RKGPVVASKSERIGVVGLGNMGGPLARHLLQAGFAVRGYDTRREAIEPLVASGGEAGSSPADLAASCPIVFTSLPSVAALEAVVEGPEGLASTAGAGSVVVETSTLPLATKERARDALAAAGAATLDCPLSGTASQMEVRDIAVYASGDKEAIDRCRPALAAFSRALYEVGEFGNGIRLKLVANHLVTVHNVAAAEALLLARRSGLDGELARRALCDGAGMSRMLEVRGPMMLSGDFSHANMRLEYYQKDIDLINAQARAVKCLLPLFSVSSQLYLAALAQGRLDEDAADVYAVLEGMHEPPHAAG
ncbi:MAG: NAD(P)-dependent oxidoreductase, partial [Acidimicrobiales bacterium]